MSDQLRPVFPPDEPNLSADSLAAAQGLLDDETRRVLELDRARLVQTTAATALALTQSLDLSPEASTEVQRALVGRVSELSPNYHNFINQLIGNSALTLAAQPQSRVYVEAEVAPHQQTLTAVHDVPPPQPEATEPALAAEDPEDSINAEDILQFDQAFKLASHQKSSKNSRKFITAVLGEEVDIDSLSTREVSLVIYQLIDTYMSTPIPQATESRKANQKERMELQFALYGPVLTANQICGKLGISTASFYTGLSRVQDSLNALMTKEKAEELVRKAVATSNHYGDTLFIQPEDFSSSTSASEPHEDVASSEIEPSSESQETRVELEEESQQIEFKEHHRTPANMLNFLTGVFPPEYGDRLHYLESWQASYLTYRIIEEFRDQLSTSSMDPGAQNEKVLRLERWTGLYKSPQDFTEIATARVTSAQNVRNGVEGSIGKIAKRLSREELDELFDQAMAYARPRRAAN